MKKVIASLFTFGLLLSSCSLFDGFSFPDTSTSEKEEITSFEFITDAMMEEKNSDNGGTYNLLTIYVDDTYQIKTNIDDKIGDDYYFTYTDFDKDIISISDTGLVKAESKGVDSPRVTLYRKRDSKRISYKSFVVDVREQFTEYANITINDSSLDYDESLKTYSLTLNSGDTYHISTSVSYNVPYNKVFELKDSSYSSFMSVSSNGTITTEKVSEDKDGCIVIKTTSTSDNNKVYDTIYLNVHLKKNEEVITEKELVVTNQSTGETLKDGDNLSLYVNDSLTFGVKYGESNKYSVMSVTDDTVLSLENDLNKITALTIGKSDVSFTYEKKLITIHVEVIKNSLVEIFAKNGADDFIIVNGSLTFLGRMFAKYASGSLQDITGSKSLTSNISNLNSTHKSVTFSYINDGITKTVTYEVKFFNPVDYSSVTTSYDFSDYNSNSYRGAYALPREGQVNVLVIPVWFTNSNTFFRDDQKEEILSDLDYVFNSIRNKDECYSVKQFYEQESNNKLTMDFIISEFYESNTSSKVYGDTIEADIERTHDLADRAITWYFANHTSEKISDYDINDDGLVDAVSLVYAANYYGTIGDSNGTTAFEFTYGGSHTHKCNNGSFSPIGGIYGFNKTSDPSKQLSVTDLSKYYPSYYFNSGSKTLIHETGHMFGFLDLYEDNHAETKYYPAGKFSMQSYDIGGHDPYQMNLRGWSKPTIYDASDYEVGDTVTLKINDFATSGNNILLTREMNENNSLFDEYMLLELFAPTGLNYYEAKNSSSLKFNDAGIRLWHVDSILKDMTNNNEETTKISDDKWIRLKYSNNDQSSESDLAHWIRNNIDEPYNTVSTVKDSYGLFKSGDHFDMETYKSQFINGDKLDNKEKLGWEFFVDSIYQTVEGNYGAIITLTRVENTRTDFDLAARVDKDISNQPVTNGVDYAKELLGDDELFSLIYNYNDASEPSYYTQGKPISYRGLCLFAEPNGNGGSLIISIKNKDGYVVRINSISITYSIFTKASVSAYVNGELVSGTTFTGPHNDIDNYNELGLTFDVISDSIILQNKYTQGTDYWSVLAIYSVSINYHIEKI